LLARHTTGEEGAVYGLDNSVGSAGRAVAPLVGSAIAAQFGIRSAFSATGIAFLAAVGLAAWLLPRGSLANHAESGREVARTVPEKD
jgi:DHA1 family multidrug resistance protein-like MFS transporter